MQHVPQLRTVRIGALLLMIPVAAETVYYAYRAFSRGWRFSFGDPERWNSHWRVDPGTVIEMAPRVGYFAIWTVVVLSSLLCFLVGLYLLNRVRKGLVFDRHSAETVRVLGLCLAAAMVIDQVYQAADAYLITRFNAAGPEPIRWFYDPSDIKSGILAVILILFGWIMRRGIEIAQENRGFV